MQTITEKDFIGTGDSRTLNRYEQYMDIVPLPIRFTDSSDHQQKILYPRRLTEELIFSLASKLKTPPDVIIWLSRGGQFPGYIFTECFRDSPYGVIITRGYDPNKKSQEAFYFERRILWGPSSNNKMRLDKIFKPNPLILVVDDILDLGLSMTNTLEYLIPLMKEHFSDPQFQTAAIWYKTSSEFSSDFYAVKLEQNESGKWPWILPDWEVSGMITEARLKNIRLDDVFYCR